MLEITCLFLAVLAYVLTAFFIAYCEANSKLLNFPSERSSHSKPVVGGAGIIFVGLSVLSWLIIGIFADHMQLVAMSIGGLALAAVSFWDDVSPLPIRIRLLVHILAASIFLLSIPVPNFLMLEYGLLSIFWYFFAIFFLVAVINLYNFMDGVDGMVALQGVAVLLAWCVVASGSVANSAEYLLCAVAASCIFGFLLHNWHPAKVFMGDVGSTFIGYTFACLAIVQTPGILRSTNFSVLLILMLPVLFDATFTLIVRFLSGEQWYKPHKLHLFQRLVQAGYSHAAVSTSYGFITVYLALLMALVRFNFLNSMLLSIPLFIIPFVLLYGWVKFAETGEEVVEVSEIYYSKTI